MIQILRYLKSAPSRGLLYLDSCHECIIDFLDAGWAGSLIDRRSTISYCVFVERFCIAEDKGGFEI